MPAVRDEKGGHEAAFAMVSQSSREASDGTVGSAR